MDDVIQRLVEIDRKCVERVEAAKAKKLDAQTNMNEKRKEIYAIQKVISFTQDTGSLTEEQSQRLPVT